MLNTQVICRSRETGNRSGPLRQRTHRHQHTLHIRVVNDGDGSGRAFYRAALDSVARVSEGLLHRSLADPDALNANGETRGVHHDEHVLKAPIFLSNQGPYRTRSHFTFLVTEQQDCCRTAMNAKLVLNRGTPDIITRAKRTIRID